MNKEQNDAMVYMAPGFETSIVSTESVLCVSGSVTTPTFDPEEEFEM